MSDQKRSQVIIENLIGDGLNGFRNRFKSICGDDVDQLTQEGAALHRKILFWLT